MEEFDFVAIGDITTDDFIRLKTAHVHDPTKDNGAEICIAFGDKIEYEFRKLVPAVGNSANAAVAAARLGLKSAFITNLGKDRGGEECIEVLKKEGVSEKYVRVHENMTTNFHYVLWYGVERTILVKHQEYPYKLPDLSPEPKWLYLSSMGHNSLDFHKEIGEYIKNHPNVKLAFQPGTFQMELGTEALADIYKRTEVFFCNVEEAQRILKIKDRSILLLSRGLHALGPKIVSITDGPDGAYLSDGSDIYFIPVYSGEVYERTGAGDAFASTFTSALALGKTPLEALAWGPINSMSVVKFIGAQEGLLSREKLEGYLGNPPAEYKPKKIS